MVGIHARTGREKIFSQHIAHVLNDEIQRKYIQVEMYTTLSVQLCTSLSGIGSKAEPHLLGRGFAMAVACDL